MLSADQGMTLAGLGLAVGVGAFAYGSIQRNDGAPGVNGVEHMALFARPSRALDERLAAARSISKGEERSRREVDFAPTATIPATVGEARVKIAKVWKDRLVLETASGVVELRPGDTAQGFGRLVEIRLVGGRWIPVVVPETPGSQSSR